MMARRRIIAEHAVAEWREASKKCDDSVRYRDRLSAQRSRSEAADLANRAAADWNGVS
jgi:hypothetical protein